MTRISFDGIRDTFQKNLLSAMPFVKLYYKLRVDISKFFANYFLIGIPKYKYSTKNGTEPSHKILGKNIFLTFLNFVAQFGTNFSTIVSMRNILNCLLKVTHFM